MVLCHHLGTCLDERWMGQKFRGEEYRGPTRMERAAAWREAGGLGGTTTAGSGREERERIFVLGVVLSGVFPLLSNGANGIETHHVWDEKCSANLFLSGNPAPGAKTIFGGSPGFVLYINTKNISSRSKNNSPFLCPLPPPSFVPRPPSSPQPCPQHPPPLLPRSR